MRLRYRGRFVRAGMGVALALQVGCGRGAPAGPAPTVVDFDLGKDTTCAVVSGGEVRCWGDNAFTSTTQSASEIAAPRRTRPARVGLGDVAATSVSLGYRGGCAAVAGAPLQCWPMDPPTGARDSLFGRPERLLADSEQVSVAGHRICAVRTGGSGRCLQGEYDRAVEIEIASARQVCAGPLHACWIDSDGVAWCQGTLGSDLRVEQPKQMATGVVDIACGGNYGCLATDAGLAECWGDNDIERGRTGFGGPPAMTIHREPDVIPGLEGVIDVAAGSYHTCAVHGGGKVSCWGDNRFGQLGGAGGGPTPVSVAGVADAVRVEVGEWHTCALKRSGALVCWGRNQRGQLGDGTSQDRGTPAPVRW